MPHKQSHKQSHKQREPRRRRQTDQFRRRRRKRNFYGAIAAETTAKLVANLLLSTVAISALVQLVPHYRVQQEKLEEIRAEVAQTEARVNRLRSDFGRHFDPEQTKKIMQEHTYRIDPNQKRIIFEE
ncbi:MAG: hypothetical protein F6J93_18515 [Oscillatoria sp. SIO1A7]|nr:hypothetical protein [Oscillatoria sp. SIO1A7]